MSMEQSGLRVDSREGSNNFVIGEHPDYVPTLQIASAVTSNVGGENTEVGDHNGPVDNAEVLSYERKPFMPHALQSDDGETLPNLFSDKKSLDESPLFSKQALHQQQLH